MNELEALDEYVPLRVEMPAWEDVLRRARHRRSPRLLVAVAVAVAVFGGAPALGIVLLHDAKPALPSGADRNNVAIVLQPHTGRVLLEVAPWRGHDGFCYFAYNVHSGCVPRSHETVVMFPPFFGWTFDPSVVSATAMTLKGTRVQLQVRRFGGRIKAAFIVDAMRHPLLRDIVLRDAQGHIVKRLRQRVH